MWGLLQLSVIAASGIFGYVAARDSAQDEERMPVFTAVRRYDLERGTIETRRFSAGNGVGEPIFVPRRPDAAEDDGWVLFLAYDQAADTTRFHILDAADVAGEPVGVVELPHRVPYGFHGNWAPAV